MLLNKNINPALGGASSGSSGPNIATSHNCQCSTDQRQQPQLYQDHQKRQLQQQQHQQHNRSNVSPSCCNPAQTDHLNENYIKHDTHSGTTLNRSNQPTLVEHTSSNSHNNTTSNGDPHYKAFKGSHKQLQLEQNHHQQQHQYQQAAVITTNNQTHQDLHEGYQPQSSSSSQLLDLQLPARNIFKRKNICVQEIEEEANTSASGTSANLNNNTNEELDDDLNFDYGPVLTKILDEKKLALCNLPDVVKFISNLQQQQQQQQQQLHRE